MCAWRVARRMRRLPLVVLQCAVLLMPATFPAELRAQTVEAQVTTGVIVGRIVEALTEAPIVGATVRVLDQDVVVQSDAAGRFTLRGVRQGIVTLDIRRLGYAPVRRGDIAVSPAKRRK
jgi:hypothetical protein